MTERYKAGASMAELSRVYKVHRQTISQHLARVGAPVRVVRISREQTEEARRLYEEGLSLESVGSRLGFDAGTIHNHLRKLGVLMRDTHGRSV